MNNIMSLLQKNNVPVTKLQWPDLKLPADIQSRGGYGEQTKGSGSLNPEVKAKMQKIEIQVKQLTMTESSLQTDYWELRKKLSSIASK